MSQKFEKGDRVEYIPEETTGIFEYYYFEDDAASVRFDDCNLSFAVSPSNLRKIGQDI